MQYIIWLNLCSDESPLQFDYHPKPKHSTAITILTVHAQILKFCVFPLMQLTMETQALHPIITVNKTTICNKVTVTFLSFMLLSHFHLSEINKCLSALLTSAIKPFWYLTWQTNSKVYKKERLNWLLPKKTLLLWQYSAEGFIRSLKMST